MQVSTSLRFAALAAIVVVTTAAQAGRYTITDLGEGRKPSAVNDVLDSVAGRKDKDGVESAVIYSAEGGGHARWHTLASGDAYATSIDAENNVAGALDGAPALWRGDTGEAVPINMPDNFVEGYATAVYGEDNPTTVWNVYGTYTATDGTRHCFEGYGVVYGIDVQDDFPWHGDFCIVTGISGYKLFGGANKKPGGPIQAFMWDNGARTLGTLPGGDPPYSMAMAGNVKREFVGCSSTVQGLHAFLYRGQMIDIGASSAYSGGTCAYAIDDSGKEIVGIGYDAGGLPHAVQFAKGDVIPLDSEVRNLGNWVLQKASGINSQGVIVGEGTIDGAVHGFMLKPD
jgi:hypothetical protein